MVHSVPMIHCPSCQRPATKRNGYDEQRRQRYRDRGETTKPIERSHIATRDRLRGIRGLKTIPTGQRFLEGFEGLQAMRRGYVKLLALVPRYRPRRASPHETTPAVIVALNILGAQLKKAA